MAMASHASPRGGGGGDAKQECHEQGATPAPAARVPQLRDMTLSVYVPALCAGLSTSIVIPVLPLYALSLGGDTAAAGAVIAVQSLGAMLADGIAGEIITRGGERVAMLVGMHVRTVAALLCGLTAVLPYLALLTFGRFVSGIGLSLFQIARQTYLGANVPSKLRGRANGLVGGAMRIANIFGPSSGGMIAHWYGQPSTFLAQVAAPRLLVGWRTIIAPHQLSAPHVTLHASPHTTPHLVTPCHTPLERGLRRFWRERPPDAVVCFVPFFGTVLRASLLAVCPSTPLLTVVTDMASSCAHNWIDPYDERESANQVIVAGSATLQQQARELGYPPAHVLSTSGMVVHPSFYGDEVEAAEGGGLKKRVASPPLGGGHKGLEPVGVIFFGGFAPMRVESIARRALRSHPSLRLVVICGGNSVLRLRLQNLNEPRCVSEGFLLPERIRDIFLTADFVIGKPGPGVVAEAIVCGVPYVTENVAPMSQETCVLEYLRSSGVGVLIPSLECLPLDLLKRCAAARDRVTHLVKNRAVFEVADYLESVVKIVSE